MKFITSRRFRGAASVVAGLIVSSAAVAQQHLSTIHAEAAPLVTSARTGVSSNAVPQPNPAATTSMAAVGSMPSSSAAEDVSLHVEPVRADILISPADGLIGQLFVALGDHVQSGQTLATVLSDESQDVLAQLSFDVERARQEARDIEHTMNALDVDLAAAMAARETAAAAAAQQANEPVDRQTQTALARAQTVYNEAVARERRAAVLEAHGVPAAQELEEAQLAVRAAATELASLRRALDAEAALGAAHALQAQTQMDLEIAEGQRQRQNRAAALVQARLRQREAEVALAAARKRLGTDVRARLEGIVTELPIRSGQRIAADAPLVTIAARSRAALP